MKITKTQLKQIIKEEIKSVLEENEEAYMTPEQVVAAAKEKVGEGKEFATMIDYVYHLFENGRIPGDYSGFQPDDEYTDLDPDYTREQNIIRQAQKEHRVEIGNIRDYFIEKYKDREAMSMRKSKAIHGAKYLDDTRRHSRGLKLNPGGGSRSYLKWIIIPNSEELENPNSAFNLRHPEHGDKAFKRNAKLPHIEVDVDEFRKQDIQQRIQRLKADTP